ncbi:MAG: glucosamine-6-phosphate deaminase [Sporolactobacillus sp.]
MKLIAVKNNEEMSAVAAQKIIEAVQDNPEVVLGLATGGTPEGTYQKLVEDYKQKGTSYSQVRTINLDEYVGLAATDSNSYRSYMKKHFFDQIDIHEENTFLPDGNTRFLDSEGERYDQLVDKLGGIDLQLLGIGRNGHIGFNEPGTPFDAGTHVVELTRSTRQANARYFNSVDDVPEKAITMGIGTILKSKAILLIVSGQGKAQALGQLLESQTPDPSIPATALIQHPNVTIIADSDALSLVHRKVGHAE